MKDHSAGPDLDFPDEPVNAWDTKPAPPRGDSYAALSRPTGKPFPLDAMPRPLRPPGR